MATLLVVLEAALFGEKDLGVIVSRARACHRAIPNHHVSGSSRYDAYTQSQELLLRPFSETR